MNSSQYDVQVRLSTVGSGEMKSNLDNIRGVLSAMQTSLNDADSGTRRLSASFRQADADGNKYSITIRQLSESQGQAAAGAKAHAHAVDSLAGSIGKMAGHIALMGAIGGAIYGTLNAIKGFVTEGIELNSLLETSRLGIAATIVSYRDYHDAQGNTVKGQAAMNMAMAESAQVQRLLQSEAFNTTATLEQMLKAYQQLQIGATAQKATSAELAAFTATLGNFATASGRSFEELSAQTSRVLQGVLTIRNPIVALLRGMGVDNATIKSWVDQGVAIQEIQKRLIEFQRIGPDINKTWTGIKSNVQDVFQQASGAMMAEVMSSVKQIGLEIVSSMTETTNEGGRQVTRLSRDTVETMTRMGQAVNEGFLVVSGVVKTVADVATGALNSVGYSWKELFQKMAAGTAVSLSAMQQMWAAYKADTIAITVNIAEYLRWAMDPKGMSWAQFGEYMKKVNGELKSQLDKDLDEAGNAAKAKLDKIFGNVFVKEDTIKSLAAMRDAMKMLGQDTSVLDMQIQILSGTFGNGDPKSKALDASVQGTIQQFKDFKAIMESKFDMSGLAGLDKALAENEVQFNQNIKTIDAWQKRLNAMSPRELGAAGITSVAKEISGLKDDAKRAQLGADQKAFDDAERKYADAYARIDKLASDSADDQIEANRKVKQQQLADLVDVLAANARTEQQMLDIIKVFNSEKKQINDQADRQRVEKFQNEMAILRDELDAITRDSYTKERADIEKAYDTRVKAIEKEYGALSANAKAEIALAQQVRDKKLALVQEEESSIVGFRKKAEDEAKKLVLSTDSIAGGVALGIEKMKATIMSTTEAVGNFVSGVWNSLGQAFETGFYDVLTGKFSDLSSVLRGLWDSILKDFSKMLAQMLTRWILLGDAMGNGQGQGGGGVAGWLQGLLGGGGEKGGSVPVYTKQGTGSILDVDNPRAAGGGSILDLDNPNAGGAAAGGGWGSYAAAGAAVIGAGILTYNAFKNGFSKTPGADISYNGTNLGQSTDFGGQAKFGDFAAAAAGVVAASALAASAITAAAVATIPVAGWIAAAAILVVGAIISIINGPKEGHFYVAISDAFEQSGARSAIGNFVHDIMDTTANFVGSLAFKAVGPDGVGKFVAAYNKAFKDALGNAKFDFHAGDGGDLNKDVTDFFNKTLPKMAMQAAFGQIGYGPHGSSDGPGGVAGMDWNINNGWMDKDGNWIKKQLYDPNAPIPALLSGIGFSADMIGEIASKLSTTADLAAFKQYLTDLVSIVAGFGDLGKQAGRSVEEWRTYFNTQASQKGTAAEFGEGMKSLQGQGLLLETLTGDDKIAAAKQLLQDSGSLLDKMAQALQSIFTMIDTIQSTTADTIKSYRDKLLTPAQRETNARAAVNVDMAAIANAANPAEVQKAWQQVMKDLSAVLDAIVARIQAIKALQQSYADFRTQMAKDAGPQFATDPTAWLAQNQREIDAVTTTLKTATGDDAIAGAQKLLQLTQERYNNELQMLQRVNAAIQSIQDTHDTTNQNLEMQAMGHVETDPTTGKKTWVQDTHAQGEYLKKQYDDLMGQLGSAKTPEEVQKIYNKMQGIISQLAAQPQDPEHYAESRRILQGMNDDSTRVAQELLKKWGKTLETDLSTTGDKLKAGETALAGALDDAQKDFEKYLGLMNDAAANATNALNDFAANIVAAMTDLGKYMAHWSFTMSHTADEKDPNWDYEKNEPKGGKTQPAPTTPVTTQDVWQDDPTDPTMQVCVSGPHKGQKRVKPAPGGSGNPNSPDNQTPGNVKTSPISLAVTVNAGTPDEIANAAADLVYTEVYKMVDEKQLALVRMLKQNQSILAAAR